MPADSSCRARRCGALCIIAILVSTCTDILLNKAFSSTIAFTAVRQPGSSWTNPGARCGVSRTCLRAALQKGDTVMVAGAVSGTGQLVVSILKELGLVPRPLVNQVLDGQRIFGGDVKGFVYGGEEPLPEASGLVITDEKGLEPKLVGACIRQLARSGHLSRVALLSAKQPVSPLTSLFGGGDVPSMEDLENQAIKDCESVDVEWTIVRTGFLRGGGPRSDSKHSLGSGVYTQYADSVTSLEEELFDLQMKSFKVGEIEENIFSKPQTSRLIAASGLAESLLSDSMGKRRMGITSVKGDELPSSLEWEAAFNK